MCVVLLNLCCVFSIRLFFVNSFWSSLRLSTSVLYFSKWFVLFSIWDASSLTLKSKFSFYGKLFCALCCFFFHRCYLLNSCFFINPTNSFIIWQPNSSFINPVTFIFFPLGYGLPNSKFEVSNLSQHILQYLLFLYEQWSCLCPYNQVLHFHHILVLHNHAKVHKLQFYLDLILISLFVNIWVVLISIVNKFFWKKTL